MCTCPAARSSAAAALYGVNCVIKGKIRKNPSPSLCHFVFGKPCQILTYGRKLRNGNECMGSNWLRSLSAIVIRYFVMQPDVERGTTTHKAWQSKASADTFLTALHNFPCGHFHPQQCDIVSSHLRQHLKRLCVTLSRGWHRKAIVMIDCGHMWRL